MLEVVSSPFKRYASVLVGCLFGTLYTATSLIIDLRYHGQGIATLLLNLPGLLLLLPMRFATNSLAVWSSGSALPTVLVWLTNCLIFSAVNHFFLGRTQVASRLLPKFIVLDLFVTVVLASPLLLLEASRSSGGGSGIW